MNRVLVASGALALVGAAQGAVMLVERTIDFSVEPTHNRILVTCTIPSTDFTPYERMLVDVVNCGPEEDEVCVHVANASESPDVSPYGYTGMRQKHWAPVGKSVFSVDLRKWHGSGDPTKVERLHFFCNQPYGSRIRLCNVRLLARDEADVARPLPDVEEAELAACVREASERVAREKAEALSCFRAACRSAGQPADAMLVGLASSMEQVRPDRPSSLRGLRPAVAARLRLARDEYESLQVVVVPEAKRLEDVSVSLAGDLVGRQGPSAVFSASNVTCEVTGYVRTRGAASYGVGRVEKSSDGAYRRRSVMPEPGWWADPILSFKHSCPVEPGVAQSFWIRVKCPLNQRPGTYFGELCVRARAGNVWHRREIPLAIHVNGFAVSRSTPIPTAHSFNPRPSDFWLNADEYDNYVRARDDPQSPSKLWRQKRTEWGDFLSDYYITFNQCFYTVPNRDFDLFKRQMDRGRNGYINLMYWGPYEETPAYEKWYRETFLPMADDAYAQAQELNIVDRVYLFGADEIDLEKCGPVALAAQKLKERYPGVPLMTTSRDPKYGVGSVLSFIDIFVPLANRFDPSQAERARAEGRKVWWYLADGPVNEWAATHVENDPIDLRSFMGAQTARMRPDGFLYWQLTSWSSAEPITDGPFTDWNVRSWLGFNGQGCLTACGPEGMPLPTLRLENYRDGLEDLCYVQMLERKLAERGLDDDWAARARELIAVPKSVMDTMTNFSSDPAALYAWRDEMADLIEASVPDLLTDLNVSQTATRQVVMSFNLTEDAILTLDMTTNGVSIGPEHFQTTVFDLTSGGKRPVCGKILEKGEHILTWQPLTSWPGQVHDDCSFAVDLKAWPLSNPPGYMVVDLLTPSNVTFYAHAGDLPGGIRTADPGDAAAVDALKDDPYRTTKLVMRRVPASGDKWLMGSPATETTWRSETEVRHYVTLTEDYFMGVYPLTFAQARTMGFASETEVTPYCYTSYDAWRGRVCWPGDGHVVDADSRLQKLRDRTGLMLDFPTEAEWEFACRAGTQGKYSTDSDDPTSVCWDVVAGSRGIKPVGLLQPNAWGFYDMHGNAEEWVLDQYGTHPQTPQIDPVGPADNPGTRVAKGGSVYIDAIVGARSAARRPISGSSASDPGYGGGIGVRLRCPSAVPSLR